MYLLRNRIVRFPIVAIGVAAWLAVSNHCALAAVEGAAKMPMSSCHRSGPANPSSPAKHDQNSGIECCKVLRATLLTLSKNVVEVDALSFAAFAYVVGILPAHESRLDRVLEWDTGPPGADSFAVSVLQRSIFAHAPPIFLS
jgi:hypothetical protein